MSFHSSHKSLWWPFRLEGTQAASLTADRAGVYYQPIVCGDRWPCPAVRIVPQRTFITLRPALSSGWADKWELLHGAHAKVQVLKTRKKNDGFASSSSPTPLPSMLFLLFQERFIPPPHPFPLSPPSPFRTSGLSPLVTSSKWVGFGEAHAQFKEFISSFGQRRRKIKGKGQREENTPYFNPDQRPGLSTLIIFQYVRD